MVVPIIPRKMVLYWNRALFDKVVFRHTTKKSSKSTHQERNKKITILQIIFLYSISLYENYCVLISISLECVSKDPINNILALVQIMAWCWTGDKPLLTIDLDELTHLGLVMHIYKCIYVLLTHWGRVTPICVSKLTIIASDNGLSPGRRQAIIWTIAGILLIGPLGTNFNEILIEIHTFSFKKMHLKMSSAKWRPFVSASMC